MAKPKPEVQPITKLLKYPPHIGIDIDFIAKYEDCKPTQAIIIAIKEAAKKRRRKKK